MSSKCPERSLSEYASTSITVPVWRRRRPVATSPLIVTFSSRTASGVATPYFNMKNFAWHSSVQQV